VTEVDLVHYAGKLEHWIRFGCHASERIIDRRRRTLFFRPGTVFAFVRWQANDYGTVKSHIDIIRALAPGAPCTSVPCVRPGGELLLSVRGWPKVARVFAAITAVEALDIDPAAICPDHWRHLHNRLGVGMEPRPYSAQRHRAWLLRQRIMT
jgi:Protein of unknown function (DUF2840)